MTTDRDVRAYVLALLDPDAGGFDVDGILDDLRQTPWWPVPDRPVRILDEMPGFWSIVDRHDRT